MVVDPIDLEHVIALGFYQPASFVIDESARDTLSVAINWKSRCYVRSFISDILGEDVDCFSDVHIDLLALQN